MADRRKQLRNRRRGGFTLIELIVAMMIVAILAVSLYGSLRAGFAAKASADAAIEPARTAELTMDILRQDLQDAVPPNPATSTSTSSTTGTGTTGTSSAGTTTANYLAGTFEGTTGTGNPGQQDDDLVFYTTADSPQHGSGDGEIKNVELTIITEANGDQALVRKVVRNLLAPQTPEPDVEMICRGVGGFGLRYFDGTTWNDSWDSTQEDNTLPAAVEVTLTLNRPNGTTANADGTRSFKYVRVIPLPCSTAAFDSTVNTGGVQ